MAPRDALGEIDPELTRALKEIPEPLPVRTAMSIELRDGVLCAFMPPVEKVEDYL
ncbi:transglutaminase family protein, partial [Streptobacillus moniliformis]